MITKLDKASAGGGGVVEVAPGGSVAAGCGVVASLLLPMGLGLLAARTAETWPSQRDWFWRRKGRIGRVWQLAVAIGTMSVAALIGYEFGWLIWRVQTLHEHHASLLTTAGAISQWWPWVVVNLAASLLSVPMFWRIAAYPLASQSSQGRMGDGMRQAGIVAARDAAAQQDTAVLARKPRRQRRDGIGVRVTYGFRTLAEISRRQRKRMKRWESRWFGRTIDTPMDAGRVAALLCATTGHGKTTLLLRITQQLTVRHGFRCLYIDLKSDVSAASEMLQSVSSWGVPAQQFRSLKVFGLPRTYELLTGPFADADAAGVNHYRRRERKAIRAALTADPQTLQELLGALRAPGQASGIEQQALDILNSRPEGGQTLGETTADAVESVWGAAAANVDAAGLDFASLPEGFTVMPLAATTEAGQRIASAVGEAFRQWIGWIGEAPTEAEKLRRRGGPVLVIMDEAGRVEQAGTDAAKVWGDLALSIRSSHVGIILATQVLSSMGAPESLDELLGNLALFVGNNPVDAEAIANLFGTHQVNEYAAKADGSEQTTGRVQHQYQVSPQTIRTLPEHVWYLRAPGGTFAQFHALFPSQPARTWLAPLRGERRGGGARVGRVGTRRNRLRHLARRARTQTATTADLLGRGLDAWLGTPCDRCGHREHHRVPNGRGAMLCVLCAVG